MSTDHGRIEIRDEIHDEKVKFNATIPGRLWPPDPTKFIQKIERHMIVRNEQTDFEEIYAIINDGASAYRGIIPADRWHEPYMTAAELKEQIDDGVQFWIYRQDDEILGVMGIQYRNSVTLIRHAYVRTKDRKKGIGSKLLKHLCELTADPVLIGTWADAKWAIEFYQKHGFRLVSEDEKNRLLRKYWTIPGRQIETSVVLASADWGKYT